MSKKMDIYGELDNFVEENEGQVTLTDVAKHFAEYGYKCAVEKACEVIARLYPEAAAYYEQPETFVEQIRKAMEE